jgi:SAM-dependent methyltransferase
MRIEALDRFRCPRCGEGELSVATADARTAEGELLEASLRCAGCGAIHPVSGGIPRFVPSEDYSESFGYQWNLHHDTQLDSVTGRPISRDRLFEVTGWPENLQGETVLEAGSGAGRFTEVLLQTGAELFSFDYSSAVEANRRNNGRRERLHLFQGDIRRIPLRPGTFDKVLCLGVIQHTPDPEKSFRSLATQVRPGGELAIDVYAKRLSAMLQWKYLLRPFTKCMEKRRLYGIVTSSVDALLPATIFLKRVAGAAGGRLMPIVEFSHLGFSGELNRQWAILDTFDMYSPAHDHPQSLSDVKRWFSEAGFIDVVVIYGPNGVVGRGRKPARDGSRAPK